MIRCFDLLLSEPSYGNCRSTQVSVIKYYGRIDMESQRERETGKMYFSAEHVRLSIMWYLFIFSFFLCLKNFLFLACLSIKHHFSLIRVPKLSHALNLKTESWCQRGTLRKEQRIKKLYKSVDEKKND
jgi:hypothetical protein